MPAASPWAIRCPGSDSSTERLSTFDRDAGARRPPGHLNPFRARAGQHQVVSHQRGAQLRAGPVRQRGLAAVRAREHEQRAASGWHRDPDGGRVQQQPAVRQQPRPEERPRHPVTPTAARRVSGREADLRLTGPHIGLHESGCRPAPVDARDGDDPIVAAMHDKPPPRLRPAQDRQALVVVVPGMVLRAGREVDQPVGVRACHVILLAGRHHHRRDICQEPWGVAPQPRPVARLAQGPSPVLPRPSRPSDRQP